MYTNVPPLLYMCNHYCIYDVLLGPSDISLETTRIQVRPMGEQTILAITLVAEQVTEEMNESLTLQLATTAATLQTIPMGEGVFFKQEIPLIIMDTERELR